MQAIFSPPRYPNTDIIECRIRFLPCGILTSHVRFSSVFLLGGYASSHYANVKETQGVTVFLDNVVYVLSLGCNRLQTP